MLEAFWVFIDEKGFYDYNKTHATSTYTGVNLIDEKCFVF